ncbi:FAD-dependent oxidoreductase, partial [Variovorax paradoxus]|uniref:NAD(P)/FAD-dependent oxidoreductase n=1 Tax=Variovorax paradoxus TaxID=34073 RepID=UPI001ABD27DE
MSTTRTLRADVAIVGGGIVGSSAALALRRMGLDVVLLERDLCGSRSSGVNYGGVRRQGRPLSQLPLAQRAHRIWGRLGELIGTEGEYQRSGHFKIGRSEDDMAALERYRASVRDAGFDLGLELVTGARLLCMAPSAFLCDGPGKGRRTCDRPLCAAHATQTGPNTHLCP